MINISDFIKAGVHFGHVTNKWNSNMKPYIFMKKNGIHIIDIYKTIQNLKIASIYLQKIIMSGRDILFVCTKKQGKYVIANYAKSINMPYVTERWLGGFLTNLQTIRQTVKKMNTIDKKINDGTYNLVSKKERLSIDRYQNKLKKNLGSVSNMNSLPGGVFVIDVKREMTAVKEAKKLDIPVFGIVDTNSNPDIIDFPIPANDDSSKSISLVIEYIHNHLNKFIQNKNYYPS